MKSLNLAAIVSLSVLMASGFANAEDSNTKNVHQNLSKRPYHQPVVEKQKNDFEGATLVTEEGEKTGVSKHKQLRINMLGQRPYVEDVR